MALGMFQNRLEMPECITIDTILQAPQGGLTYPSYGQELSPFTLSGSPIRPKSITGLTEHVRKANASKSTDPIAYFAADNYDIVNILSENIIGTDISTTLRFNEKTYSLTFISLHSPIWNTETIQVSLLFTAADGSFFHICIPVVTGTNENIFLKAWLTGKDTDSTITVNELLNFRSNDVRFAILDFCLSYESGKYIKPYVFCIFKTPLYISQSSIPKWLSDDPLLSNPQAAPSPTSPYRRKTFNDVFNHFMRGYINVNVLGKPDPYLTGKEMHFDSTRTQIATTPAYFKVDSKKLSGISYGKHKARVLEGFQGEVLENIKCYPIDLVRQVDDNGNIYVDETTNKPIDITSERVNIMGANVDEPDLLSLRAEQANNQSWIRYTVIFSILAFICLSVIAVAVVFFFRGKSSAAAAAAAATAANRLATAASAATPGSLAITAAATSALMSVSTSGSTSNSASTPRRRAANRPIQ